jgi:hypothetical protein
LDTERIDAIADESVYTIQGEEYHQQMLAMKYGKGPPKWGISLQVHEWTDIP